MSAIFISVGQCGNQISKSLIDHLINNPTKQTSYLYNHFDGKFHFVNLDSEIKVINNLLNEHKSSLRLENLINTRCGRGSNWASGYSGLEKDGSLKIIEQSLEAIRKESERCDFLLNLVMIHSLSGGTGSGCGSKLIEQLRDEYGWKKYILTQSIAPFKDGELPLQHYNNLLCMSHLHEYSDFIGLYQNDDIIDMIEKQNLDNFKPNTSLISSKTGLLPFNSSKLIKRSYSSDDIYQPISMNDMNNYIVKCLLNMINPIDHISLKTQSIGMEIFELLRFLCPNNNLKIYESYTINSSVQNLKPKSIYDSTNSTKSNSLLKKLLTKIPKYKQNSSEHYTSLNSLIIARGNQDFSEYNEQNIIRQLINDKELINKSLNPVEWNPFSIDFWSSKNSLNDPISKSAKTSSLTLCTNRNKSIDYLKLVLDRSLKKYHQKAYLHWYNKFNIKSDKFENAFENLRVIIDNYETWTL